MLPEVVNMIATVTYLPHEVKESLVLMNPEMEVTDQDVLDLIRDWADEDCQGLEYVLLDQDGEEL